MSQGSFSKFSSFQFFKFSGSQHLSDFQTFFSLVIKTKVFQNVNRMSKRQSDRKEDIQSAGQTDRVTERQNDSMTVWQIAGQLKSPLLFK